MWLNPDRKSMSAFLRRSSCPVRTLTQLFQRLHQENQLLQVSKLCWGRHIFWGVHIYGHMYLCLVHGTKWCLWLVDNVQAEEKVISWSYHIWSISVCWQHEWAGCDEVERQQKHTWGLFSAMIVWIVMVVKRRGFKPTITAIFVTLNFVPILNLETPPLDGVFEAE